MEILTGSMTAPVVGSWGLPAWTAKVPKLCAGEEVLGSVPMGSSVLAGDIVWRKGRLSKVGLPREEKNYKELSRCRL